MPEAFVNYLALLGWSPRGDEEIVPRQTLINEFRLEDVSHSPAFFDVKKMRSFNGEYIRRLSLDEFLAAVAPWVRPWATNWQPTDRTVPWTKEQFDEALFTRVAPLVQERVAVLSEVPSMVAFFFLDTAPYDDADFAKAIANDPLNQALLAAAIERFASEEWNATALHASVVEPQLM